MLWASYGSINIPLYCPDCFFFFLGVTHPESRSKIFSGADFTTGTTPQYNDPEGDSPYSIKILSLPAKGSLKLDNVDVQVNQEILISEVDAGYLVYVPDLSEESGLTLDFDFAVSDNGSKQFTT